MTTKTAAVQIIARAFQSWQFRDFTRAEICVHISRSLASRTLLHAQAVSVVQVRKANRSRRIKLDNIDIGIEENLIDRQIDRSKKPWISIPTSMQIHYLEKQIVVISSEDAPTMERGRTLTYRNQNPKSSFMVLFKASVCRATTRRNSKRRSSPCRSTSQHTRSKAW